jgi:hypothetical protein
MGGFLDFATSAGGGSLLGGIATGLFGRSSAKQTNEQTERLSSTAHQRATKDLRLAGLNPILSATGGMGSGASTPQLKDPGEAMVKGVGTGASSALQAARMNQELKNLAATENFTKEQTKAIKYGVPGKTLGTLAIDKTLGVLKDVVDPPPVSSAKSITPKSAVNPKSITAIKYKTQKKSKQKPKSQKQKNRMNPRSRNNWN